MQRQGGSWALHWGGAGFPSGDMHSSIFELLCRTKTTTRRKIFNCLMKHPSFQRERLRGKVITKPPGVRGYLDWRQAGPASPLTRRLLTALLMSGRDTVSRALAHCGPLCLTKQYSCSFLLHPTLSPRFSLMPVYTGWFLVSGSVKKMK